VRNRASWVKAVKQPKREVNSACCEAVTPACLCIAAISM